MPVFTAFFGEVYPNKKGVLLGKKLSADLDFFPTIEVIEEIALESGVRIWITSSYRNPKTSRKGNHHTIGHAIDLNIFYENQIYNSIKLQPNELESLAKAVRTFIENVRKTEGLRWGGDFPIPDPIHIVDGILIRHYYN